MVLYWCVVLHYLSFEVNYEENNNNTSWCTLTACTPSSTTKNKKYINSEGTTLKTRILVPKGYQREQSDFAHFLQIYPLKKNGSLIHLYNGKKKFNQNSQIVIFKLPLENENLQRDSLLSIYYKTIKIHRLNETESYRIV